MFLYISSRFLVGLMLGLGVCFSVASANMIAVSNVTFGAQQTTADTNGNNHYMPITFNLTWQNAWRDASSALTASPPTGNYDAAWVFIKYSLDGTTWYHATLGPTAVSGTTCTGTTNCIGGGDTTKTGTTGGLGGIGYINNPGSYFYGGTVNVGSNNNIPLDVIIPNEATSGYKGAFVQISSVGTSSGLYGNITPLATASPVGLVWNYGADEALNPSLTDTTAATAIVQVMAIEMIYVPTAPFYLGDGTTGSGNITRGRFCAGINYSSPYHVTSSQGVTVLGGGGSGSLGNNNGTSMYASDDWNDSSLTPPSLPSTFPEGYNAFYMMKYDVTQGQYRDFLNTLTRTQQENMVFETLHGVSAVPTNIYVMMHAAGDATPQNRNGIIVSAVPSSTAQMTFACYLNAQTSGQYNGTDDGEYISMSGFSWIMTASNAAWSALRPMTELEYEKAALYEKGNLPTANQYAWGIASPTTVTSIQSIGLVSETAMQTGNGLVNASSSSSWAGPMRVGFAATSSTSRVQAAASYWGIMNLSDNMNDRWISIGSLTGRNFVGSNGSGTLSINGYAQGNADWPGWSSSTGEIIYSYAQPGIGLSPSSWNSSVNVCANRYFANAYYNTAGFSFVGSRYVRTAP